MIDLLVTEDYYAYTGVELIWVIGIRMDKGPYCENKVYEFYSDFLKFNNISVYSPDFHENFYNFDYENMKSSLSNNEHKINRNVSIRTPDVSLKILNKLETEGIFTFKNIFIEDVEYLKNDNSKVTSCELVFVGNCNNLKYISNIFPNVKKLYIKKLCFSNINQNVKFKKVQHFSCINTNIEKFFSQVSFNMLEELNLYETNTTNIVSAPSWVNKLRVIRIPPNVMIDEIDETIENRVLQYIYTKYPDKNMIETTKMPQIKSLNKFYSILFPVNHVTKEYLIGPHEVGMYLFDNNLSNILSNYDFKKPIYLHNLNKHHMAVLERYKENVVALTNENIFKNTHSFNLWKKNILPYITVLYIKKIVNVDKNGNFISISNSLKIVYYIKRNYIYIETSAVHFDILINLLLYINDKLDNKKIPKKIKMLTTTFNNNVKTLIRSKVEGSIEFV